ncbi:MAG: hypothetical protein AAGE61_06340, partial [Pseudomonadota bacterium]
RGAAGPPPASHCRARVHCGASLALMTASTDIGLAASVKGDHAASHMTPHEGIPGTHGETTGDTKQRALPDVARKALENKRLFGEPKLPGPGDICLNIPTTLAGFSDAIKEAEKSVHAKATTEHAKDDGNHVMAEQTTHFPATLASLAQAVASHNVTARQDAPIVLASLGQSPKAGRLETESLQHIQERPANVDPALPGNLDELEVRLNAGTSIATANQQIGHAPLSERAPKIVLASLRANLAGKVWENDATDLSFWDRIRAPATASENSGLNTTHVNAPVNPVVTSSDSAKEFASAPTDTIIDGIADTLPETRLNRTTATASDAALAEAQCGIRYEWRAASLPAAGGEWRDGAAFVRFVPDMSDIDLAILVALLGNSEPLQTIIAGGDDIVLVSAFSSSRSQDDARILAESRTLNLKRCIASTVGIPLDRIQTFGHAEVAQEGGDASDGNSAIEITSRTAYLERLRALQPQSNAGASQNVSALQ